MGHDALRWQEAVLEADVTSLPAKYFCKGTCCHIASGRPQKHGGVSN